MKQLILSIFLLVFAGSVLAQSVGDVTTGGTTRIYVKTNFTTSTADTTNYFDISKYSDVGFIYQSTDSAAFDIYFDGRNNLITAVTTTYADSLVTTSNTGSQTSTVIKSTTLNRLPNETQVRMRVIARNTGQGTTSGRTLKGYLVFKQP